MLLYHYSDKKRTELLTRRLQGNYTEKDLEDAIQAAKYRGDPGPYLDHVSFFIEPVPTDILPDIFPRDHDTWFRGNRIYEHQVEVDDLDLYGWVMVETPIKNFLMNYLWFDNKTYKRFYFKMVRLARHIRGEIGTNTRELEKCINSFEPGTTRKAFEKLAQDPNFEKSRYKYAPLVPHLMIYTEHPIKPVSIERCILGRKKGDRNVSQESLGGHRRASQNW